MYKYKFITVIKVLAIILLAFGIYSKVSAAPTTITYDSSFTLSNDVVGNDPYISNTIRGSQLHGFQYFDTTLGTLLSVDISIHSEYTSDLQVYGQNTSIDPFVDVFQATAIASSTSSIDLFPGGFDTGFYNSVPTALSFETTCYGGATGATLADYGRSTCDSRYSDDDLFLFFPEFLTISVDNTISTTDVSAFLGIGMFNVLGYLDTSVSVGADYLENDIDYPVGEAYVDWYSYMTVAYTYDTVSSVTEPSSISLLAIALFGLFGIARRKV